MFSDAELDYLASQRLGRLATAQPDGTLQVSPVGFRYNDDTATIDIGGFRMAVSRKFRNVADNGRVAFVVDDLASVQPWRVRCLEIRGRAEAIADPAGDGSTDPGAAIIRIHPERIISFGIGELDREPHELTLNARDVT
jgi:pyridoxamine 5'-phosphate oxidase family protein